MPSKKVIQIIPPHKGISRFVEEKDLARVYEDAWYLARLCHTPIGNYPGGYAVAHCQFTKEDPLCFFVTSDGLVVINPKVMRHSSITVKRVEGCLSYPFEPQIAVERWNKMEVEFYSLDKETRQLTGPIEMRLSGINAQVFQHEMDHFKGKTIYDL
jgi:hypothetical protein